eukprot:gb/GEZN01010417.1/.p1 GENE.gb/GEZN01010417.1/~~gb/GEZN01010417.1/.p1  ORF type:complete len:322 (+),score=39.43 gb/GEZN01010417.1/:66-968(+)
MSLIAELLRGVADFAETWSKVLMKHDATLRMPPPSRKRNKKQKTSHSQEIKKIKTTSHRSARDGRVWTAREVERLKELIDQGMKYEDIGLELGRTAHSVKHRHYLIKEMGYTEPSQSRKWTEEENERLQELLCQGRATVDIAREFGRSKEAVVSHSFMLRYNKQHPEARGASRFSYPVPMYQMVEGALLKLEGNKGSYLQICQLIEESWGRQLDWRLSAGHNIVKWKSLFQSTLTRYSWRFKKIGMGRGAIWHLTSIPTSEHDEENFDKTRMRHPSRKGKRQKEVALLNRVKAFGASAGR